MKRKFYTDLVGFKKIAALLLLASLLTGIDGNSSGGKDNLVQPLNKAGYPRNTFLKSNAAKALACPCTLFTPADGPALPETNLNDASAIEIGLKFQADVNGFILGIRFYKPSADVAAVHTVTLWDNLGNSLGTATTSGETASGWQQANFVTPISITGATTYVASYYSAGGFYSATNFAFTAAIVVPPLTGLVDGGPDGTNGVYNYDPTNIGTIFPDQSFRASNYWVDPVFTQSLVLPITLVNFKAAVKNADVQLSWQTQTEQNNAGFEIQRSADGLSWTDIAFVKGAGQSNQVLDYSYTDRDMSSGHYTYRLKQLDLDNHFTFSLTVSAAISAENHIRLIGNFPNPFIDQTTIQYALPAAMKIRLTVLDLQGRLIRVLADALQSSGQHTLTFDARGISSGVYYYKLETEGQSPPLVRKMVIK